MERDPIVVAGRVRELMNRAGEDVKGLTAALLDEGHYISAETIYNLLRAKYRRTQTRHLAAIARHYNVSLAHIEGLVNESCIPTG